MGGSEKYSVLSGGGGGKNNTYNTSTTTNSSSKKSSGKYRENNTSSSSVPPGCMNGVFQFFDFHQFQLSSVNHHVCFKPPNHSSNFIHHEELQLPNLPIKGVEAPRNSLESEENLVMEGVANETVVVLSSKIKEEEFGFPVGIRVQTKRLGGISDFSSSESSNSPSIKTPTLVARLMGLDILPDQQNSPNFSSSSSSSLPSSTNSKSSKTQTGNYLQDSINGGSNSIHHRQVLRNRLGDVNNTGSRSLPDTPRISSARRSDVDPSRLSLQINKENILMNEEFDYFGGRSSVDSVSSLSSLSSLKKSRRRSEWRSDENESRSPSHYARQIVKQVKESVSRRMGRDITNYTTTTTTTTTTPTTTTHTTTSKKPSRLNRSNNADDSTQSCSPRIRFLENKQNINKRVSTILDQDSNSLRKSSPPSKPPPASPPPMQPPKPPPASPPPPLQMKVKTSKIKPKTQAIPQHQTIEKCKKASCERFTQRKEVVSLRKSTVSPSKQVNLKLPNSQKKLKKSSTSSSSPLSKDICVISSPTPTSMNFTQLSSTSNSPSGTSLSSSLHSHRNEKLTRNVAEFRYVSNILKCTGIETNSYISFTKWYSPSHPLDPSIFHHLEESFFPTGSLRHRTNRRLIFNLVDEILVDILRPYLNMKPWVVMNSRNKVKKLLRGDQLLQKLWVEIQDSPLSNCQFLQDIDALIEKDLPSPHDANIRTLPILEEGESIVLDIERDILDSLVHEIALTAFS